MWSALKRTILVCSMSDGVALNTKTTSFASDVSPRVCLELGNVARN